METVIRFIVETSIALAIGFVAWAAIDQPNVWLSVALWFLFFFLLDVYVGIKNTFRKRRAYPVRR